MGLLSYGYKIWKAGKKTSPTISKVNPTVNTTKLEKKISETTKAVQKAKGSGAKLSQSIFELKNNMPITFKGSKTKTLSNTELKKKADARIKEKKQETKTKHFYAPKNFNKGGRVGLKSGSKFPDHSGDGKITQKDILMAKGVIPKTKSKKKII